MLWNSWIDMSLVEFFSQFCVGRHHKSHWKRPIMAIRHKANLNIWFFLDFLNCFPASKFYSLTMRHLLTLTPKEAAWWRSGILTLENSGWPLSFSFNLGYMQLKPNNHIYSTEHVQNSPGYSIAILMQELYCINHDNKCRVDQVLDVG